MIDAMNMVWAHYPHKGGRLLLMLALANYANQDGMCWPSVPTLAGDARLKLRQTKSLLHDMAADGDITIFENQGPRGTNLYQINLSRLHQNKSAKTALVQKSHGAKNSKKGVQFSHAAEGEMDAKTAPEPSSKPPCDPSSSSSTPDGVEGDDVPNQTASKSKTTETYRVLRKRGIWAAREFADEPLDLIQAYLARVGPDYPPPHIVEDLRAGLHRESIEPQPSPDVADPESPQFPDWIPEAHRCTLPPDMAAWMVQATWDSTMGEIRIPKHNDRFRQRFAYWLEPLEACLKGAL